MGGITIGGLATGLDTNSIVGQLVALERQRAVGFLQEQRFEASTKEAALQQFNTKVASLLGTVDALRDSTTVATRQASSSDAGVLGATAGTGAVAGSTEITVNQLASGSIATSVNAGLTSADATIASGAGTFEFQVGSGAAQSIAIDATTTLSGLATEINNLDAGVSASVVNIGTEASPDFRIRIASQQTGSSNEITINNDDTDLGVSVTQNAQDAQLVVSGFADPFTRESNVVSDVIPGVTLTLAQAGGPVNVTVETDQDAVANKVQSVVDSFNDLVDFVERESQVQQNEESEDRAVAAGPLAFDSTVRNILDSIRSSISTTVAGSAGGPQLLVDAGVKTTREGRLELDSEALKTQLSNDEGAVVELFAGGPSGDGVFDQLHTLVDGYTGSGGLIEISTKAQSERVSTLDDRILAAERQVAEFEDNLRAIYTNLEVLVGGLQSQGSFLANAF